MNIFGTLSLRKPLSRAGNGVVEDNSIRHRTPIQDFITTFHAAINPDVVIKNIDVKSANGMTTAERDRINKMGTFDSKISVNTDDKQIPK